MLISTRDTKQLCIFFVDKRNNALCIANRTVVFLSKLLQWIHFVAIVFYRLHQSNGLLFDCRKTVGDHEVSNQLVKEMFVVRKKDNLDKVSTSVC